jgi:predicted Zn finger-like uncharacterized protein
MRFVCDRCQTRYNIADEKIRQRIVRIRCKNCGGVITLHAGEVMAGAEVAPARLSGNRAAISADVRAPSKLSRPPARRSEWFVAVDGKETGPLTCGEAAKYIVTLGPEHVIHVWKEGMDEWKRPADVAIISQELSALKRSPIEAPNADATMVTPVPLAFDASPKLAPPKSAGSAPKPALSRATGSLPKLPGMSAKPSSSGSASTGTPFAGAESKAVASAPGSVPKPARPSGIGLQASSPAAAGSGPKAPPPIPGGHRASSPTGSVPRVTPIAAVHAVPDARPVSKFSTHPVVKTPPPAAGPRATPIAAVKALPDARLFAKPSAKPLIRTPLPAAERKPAHETALALDRAEPMPGTASVFDDQVLTSADSRHRAALAAQEEPSPERTPVVESTPGANDFAGSEKTPPPSQPLPPVGAAVHPIRESKNWPVANLSFAHPPAMPEGMSAEGAMALPTPAPLDGPLFANVADLPVKSLVGHAEIGLSKLTGLAGLVHKHRHLKYVAASGLFLILIIAVILLSWQGENGKGVAKVAEIEKKARAAALAAEPVTVASEESEPAVAPSVGPEPSKTHAPAHTSKRGSRPQALAPAPAPSGKPAPVEDPFAPPAGMTRSAEKPIPLAAVQGRRATAGEPRAISQAQISEVVRNKENQAGLKTCYERALKRDGRLRTGRLDITVSIGPMGTVQRVQVHGSADFMVIDKCLKEAIRHWRFPANAEEYATSFPLILQGG